MRGLKCCQYIQEIPRFLMDGINPTCHTMSMLTITRDQIPNAAKITHIQSLLYNSINKIFNINTWNLIL